MNKRRRFKAKRARKLKKFRRMIIANWRWSAVIDYLNA